MDSRNMKELNPNDLDAVAGGKANGEWEYRIATQEDLNQIGTGPFCPECREVLFKITDYNHAAVYYTCNACRIQWTYKIGS